MQITPIPGRCVGHGMCVAYAPDLLDDGLVEVLTPDIPDDQRDLVRDVLDACPAQALALADDTSS
nr:hypothetical protein ISGA_216 [Gordonia sp. NB41Y]